MSGGSSPSSSIIATAPPDIGETRAELRELESRFVDAVREMQRVTEKVSWEAIKYLTLVNGTGAIALLGFMGSSQDVRHSTWAWAALFCYFAGIVFVGCLIALAFHKGWAALTGLAKNGAAWRRGELTYDEVFKHLAESATIGESLYFAYGAFLFFIVGTLVAVIGH